MNLEFGVPYHHKTIDQCRAIGARGGRRSGIVRRAGRLAQFAGISASDAEPQMETAHEASMLLDKQFPHLRNAWASTARAASRVGGRTSRTWARKGSPVGADRP